MKRTKTSKQWMMEHIHDVYVQRAKAEGYRSRAAYKLIEVVERDKLLKPGMVVVDLGATPGGWSQVAAAKVGERGRVIALDLLPMDALRNVTFLLGDFREDAVVKALEQELAGRPIDLVLSDMSPNISGIALSDQARAMYLAELALEFAVKHLKPGGGLLVKVFQGSGFQEFLRVMRSRFKQVVTRKPEASRGRSNEMYLLGKDCKGAD
ncbi:MAG: RlmE family RNA methyltransferase [Betaproteobacteria bacterium]|nr:RlmE family RNA methyltransferase [Betaproteobacteria bacterium]